jgi:arylsulfatase A-like enzyme
MAQPPNIVLITWHDAGRHFGCYGHPTVHTPNVDRLAREGCRFENMIAACAICSPSRAAIATGRYCQDSGVMYLTNTVNSNRLHPSERHIAKRLKEDHGYHTALFGVQHECAHEHVSEVIAPDDRLAVHPWPQAPVSAENFERWMAARAGDGRPFYAQIGFFEAHLNAFYSGSPPERYPQEPDTERGLTVPPYLADNPRARETLAHLQGLLRRGDEAIGRILTTIEKAGVNDNTLVVMCVDHGVGIPRAKTTCYDSGIGVSWILRWPGRIPAGSLVRAMATHVDVLPTVFDLMGLPVPENVEGVSFAGHVLGRRDEELRDEVFSHMVENTRSIRTTTHKLIRNFRPPQPGGGYATKLEVAPEVAIYAAKPPHVELYDLEADPQELRNLADDPEHSARRAELDARLWDFLLDHNDFIVNEPVDSDWQKVTRRHLEEHCRAAGRPVPVIDG